MKVAHYTFKSAMPENEETTFGDVAPYLVSGAAGATAGGYLGSKGLSEARQKHLAHLQMMKDIQGLKEDAALQTAYRNSLLRTAGGTLAGAAVGAGVPMLVRGMGNAYRNMRNRDDE